jgi:NAD(P)-dependent dehydrogenase (short-subunit alcohol dehydrogenase family)
MNAGDSHDRSGRPRKGCVGHRREPRHWYGDGPRLGGPGCSRVRDLLSPVLPSGRRGTLESETVGHRRPAALLGRTAAIRALFDRCEASLGPVDILVNNHTHCALDTFDPAGVKTEGFGVDLFSAAVADEHFPVNARSYALMMAEYTPLGRCGVPDDVAEVILLLASNQAHWLTGQLLSAGGGWRMHR